MRLTDVDFSDDTHPLSKYRISPDDSNDSQRRALERLIGTSVSESRVDAYLRKNAALLANCLNLTSFGHHGAWVIPQQDIRPPLSDTQCGLRPDYLVGGKGSQGFTWLVVELKGVDEPLFALRGRHLSLSRYAAAGVCQLLEYISYCNQAQAYLRDSLHLTDFSNPRGILIIGRELELSKDSRKSQLRKQINDAFSGRIEIRSFDALLRQA